MGGGIKPTPHFRLDDDSLSRAVIFITVTKYYGILESNQIQYAFRGGGYLGRQAGNVLGGDYAST